MQSSITDANDAARHWPTTVPMVLAILALGLIHRAVQLWLVAPVVSRHVALNPGWLSMQYLPAEQMEKHFAAAMLYLQQTPPLPSLVIGLLSQLTTSPEIKTLATIACAGMLSCVAAALLAALLLRMRVWPPLAFALALLFLGNGGVVLLEYTAFGQCFYEQLAMVACMVAALAAESLARRGSWQAAAWLGCAVALAALSRATFSYLVFPVVAWLVWQRVRPKYLLVFLLPVMLLHGGWAAKQYAVQGKWLWATSTWGGANAMAGDIKRNAKPVSKRIECADRWAEALSGPSIFVTFAMLYPDPAHSLEKMNATTGPSPAARAVDLAALEARSQWSPWDSAGFRELSACVQRMYIRQWLRHPGEALEKWAKSYVLFWQPLDSYTAAIPVTLVAIRTPLTAEPGAALRHFFGEPEYFAREEAMPWFINGANKPRLVPANVAVIPFAPQLATGLAFAMLHCIPFVAAFIFWKRGSWKKNFWKEDIQKSGVSMDAFPPGFSFLLLLYLYVAGISNLVEYGENMRFRLPVEPIVWAIGAVAASILFDLARRTAARPGIDTAAIS